MGKIQIDQQGRKFFERPDGTRVYIPTTPPSAESIARNREHLDAWHRSMAHTFEQDDTDEMIDEDESEGSGS